MSELKVCTKCKEAKLLSEYYRKKGQASGLNPSCKACCVAKVKLYYKANSDSVKIRVKKWRDENLERAKAAAKDRYRKRAAIVKEKARAWAEANPERRREIVSASAEKHREKKNEKNKAYNREFRRLYPQEAREEGRMRAAVRRTREIEAGVNITRGNWKAIIELFDTGMCLYCGTDGHKLTMDHWMPVSLGGKTEVGNLIPCCKSCNSRKSNMHPDEWMRKIGATDERGYGYATIPQFLEISRQALVDDEVAA